MVTELNQNGDNPKFIGIHLPVKEPETKYCLSHCFVSMHYQKTLWQGNSSTIEGELFKNLFESAANGIWNTGCFYINVFSCEASAGVWGFEALQVSRWFFALMRFPHSPTLSLFSPLLIAKGQT